MTRALAAALLALGAVLFAHTEPGFFTIDEQNYLATVVAYRHGSVSLPGLDGITPSPELAFFDPNFAAPPAAPPVNELPPLYGLVALPFAVFGLRGLIALNTLAFLATAALVFAYVRRHAARPTTAWLAAGTFVFASHSLEYALGVWPHALSTFLCTSAFVMAAHARRTDDLRWAALAGLCAGLAAGVRYPNAVYGACVALMLWLWMPRRWEALVAFWFAGSVPLVTSAALNHARLGHWNPISKKPGYLAVGGDLAAPGNAVATLTDWGASFWIRMVDDAARSVTLSRTLALTLEPESGAFVVYGVVKKAWLQSSPWVALALVAGAAAWWLRVHGDRTLAGAAAEGDRVPPRPEAQACALPIAGVLATFAVAGVVRSDGMSFNGRYLLDLVPLACALFAWTVEHARVTPRPAWLGGFAAAGAGAWVLHALDLAPRATAERWTPLFLAATLVVAFAARERAHAPGRVVFSLVVGATLGWSAAIHLGHDVRTSLARRAEVAAMRAEIPGRLPERAAVLTWGIYRSVMAPEQLDHDVVILDCSRDQGRDAASLTAEFLARGRRVFILANGFPNSLRAALMERFGQARWDPGRVAFVELRPKSAH